VVNRVFTIHLVQWLSWVFKNKERKKERLTVTKPEKFLRIKVGLGISWTKADSQWNPVYKAFHQIRCCGNETIRRQQCKRDLDAAHLRPALEQGCGRRQTPSDSILFSHTMFGTSSTGLNVLAKNRRNCWSQLPRCRPQSRKNEISEISPSLQCLIQVLERSNSRISCRVNGERRSSWKVVWVTTWGYAFETSTKR